MTAKVAELRQRRVAMVGELRAWHGGLVDEKTKEPRALTTEEKGEFTKRESAIGELEQRLEQEEQLESLERRANEERADTIRKRESAAGRNGNGTSRTAAQQTALAVQGWVRARRGRELSDEHQEAMQAYGLRAGQDEIEIRLLDNEELRLVPKQVARVGRGPAAEQRMLTTATHGGELIPEGFVNNWELALLAVSQLRNFVTILRTATGNDLPWPTTNDTANVGELLAEEGGAATLDVDTTAVVLGAYKYSSKIVKVSAELLEDSAFNLVTMLGQLLGTRIARITNTHFTTGTGTGQPKGIITAATQAFVMASASAISPDEVTRMPYEIDPEYQVDPSCGWMMHNAIIKLIRLLRDGSGGAGTGQYLWQPGLVSGEPDSLAGYPVCLNQGMASAVGVNAKIMLFGAMGKYLVRDVSTMRLFHLKELYRANDQEGFIAFSRHDADLLDAGTHPIKYAQMAAS